MGADARQVHPPCGQLDDAQHVERFQPDGLHGADRRPMSSPTVHGWKGTSSGSFSSGALRSSRPAASPLPRVRPRLSSKPSAASSTLRRPATGSASPFSRICARTAGQRLRAGQDRRHHQGVGRRARDRSEADPRLTPRESSMVEADLCGRPALARTLMQTPLQSQRHLVWAGAVSRPQPVIQDGVD
jgi:hypothetical protein